MDLRLLNWCYYNLDLIVGLPWDLGERIWKVGQGLEELTFFGYFAKKGYRINRAPR
jgi:hypothetical protein